MEEIREEFDIEKFDINSNCVLSASAGTGKTYSIVKIVEKLIKGNIPLGKILVVTYTEKAAGELKDRLRRAFGDYKSGKYEKEDAERIMDAYNAVDNASVGTIHSFCRNIIEEFPISSGRPSGQKLIGDAEKIDFIKRYIRKGKIYKDICRIKNADPDIDIEEGLTKKLSALLDKYYLDKNYEETADIVRLDKSAEIVWDIYFDVIKGSKTVHECFPDIIDRISKIFNNSNGKLKENVEKLSSMKDAVKLSGNIRSCKTDEEKEAYETVRKINEMIKNLQNKAKGLMTSFLAEKYAKSVYKEWQEEKEARNEQTYSDMLRVVRENVVNGGGLLDRIREKYTYAIIDEFQDTNRIQWDVFKTAFLDDADHHIIVVGDKKQSIYSFQNADLTVYESAISDIKEKGKEYTLNTNYRASEKIIDATNAFFNTDPIVSEVKSPVENGFKALYDNEETEAYWIHGENAGDSTSERYAKAVCQTIIDCCRKNADGSTKLRITDENGKKGDMRNVTFKDFAVLARTRSEMKEIERAFDDCGIPYVRYKDNSLFSGMECASWISLLDAINVPDFTGKNRVLFKKALHSQFFGVSLDDIKDPKYDRDDIKEIAYFEKWRALASERRFEELLDSILAETDIGKRFDLKSGGKIRQIGDLCTEYLSEHNSLQALASHLRDCSSGIGEEDENGDIIAKSTDLSCVSIMTMHASKGLEFPVVISVARSKKIISSEIYGYHDGDGKRVISFEKPKNYDETEAAPEWRRLFYVAYTRAKYILILPNFKALGNSFDFIATDITNYKDNRPYRKIPDCDAETFDGLGDGVKEIIPPAADETDDEKTMHENAKKIIGKRHFHSTYKHSYASLSHPAAHDVRLTDDGEKKNQEEDEEEAGLSEFDKNALQVVCEYDGDKTPMTFSADFPAGAELGNAIHRMFELVDYDSVGDNETLIKKCFAEEGFRIKDEWVNDCKAMISSVLSAKLPVINGAVRGDGSFTLSGIGKADRINEAEFNFNKGSEFLSHYFNGFIDLVFRHGGRYCILDWKSDRLSDKFVSYSDGNELKDHVDKCYSIQRVLYSYCLIKWLAVCLNKSEESVFNDDFGGIYYVFVRGCDGTGNGIYAQTWKSYGELKAAYDNIVKIKVH